MTSGWKIQTRGNRMVVVVVTKATRRVLPVGDQEGVIVLMRRRRRLVRIVVRIRIVWRGENPVVVIGRVGGGGVRRGVRVRGVDGPGARRRRDGARQVWRRGLGRGVRRRGAGNKVKIMVHAVRMMTGIVLRKKKRHVMMIAFGGGSSSSSLGIIWPRRQKEKEKVLRYWDWDVGCCREEERRKRPRSRSRERYRNEGGPPVIWRMPMPLPLVGELILISFWRWFYCYGGAIDDDDDDGCCFSLGCRMIGSTAPSFPAPNQHWVV